MLKRLQHFFLSPLFIGLLFLFSVVLRRYSLPVISLDMSAGLFDWYGFIIKRGFVNAFKEDFALYTPPYLYLLWLATLVNGIVSQVTIIKLISIAFDLLSSFFIYKIIWLKYPHSRVPLLAAVLGFTLPTVLLNSAYWGQCDSIYTSFLLACMYFILVERPVWALFFFSLAFAFKLQAIFLLPFLAVYWLRKRIPWLSFLIIPAVYGVLSVPTILAGRPWLDVLTIYAHQTEKFPKWSSTTPTMYLPLQGRLPLTPVLTFATVILAALILSLWIYFSWKKSEKDSHASIILTALASVALFPFILPRMHQRYFYPQDMISLVAAFFVPELWFLPILSQVISVLSYSPFLFNLSIKLAVFGRNLDAILFLALPIEIIILAVTLWRQFSVPNSSTKTNSPD
ncbi:MAG TPA: hypothetical protein VGK00_06255 [Anaerolineales bacterium]